MLWQRVDFASTDSVEEFITELNTVARGTLQRYGTWEGGKAVSMLLENSSRRARMASAQRRARKWNMVNVRDPDFWRSRRADFEAMAIRQRSSIRPNDPRWLVGHFRYGDGTSPSEYFEVRGGLGGGIRDFFDDISAQAGLGLGCPPGLHSSSFWLSSLCQDLLHAPPQRAYGELLLQAEGEVIVHDLLGSSSAFCSRLATLPGVVKRPAARGDCSPGYSEPNSGTLYADRVHFQYRYPEDFPADAQRQMESLRLATTASLRGKPIDSFADWSEAKRVWVLEIASGAATIIGKFAAMKNWSANQAREVLKDFTLQAAFAAEMTAPAAERFFKSDEWKRLDDELFPPPETNKSPALTPPGSVTGLEEESAENEVGVLEPGFSYERISQDDPNHRAVKRFSLKAWSDSFELNRKKFAGQTTLKEIVDACVVTFTDGTKTLSEIQDDTPMSERCRLLDSLAAESLTWVGDMLSADSQHWGGGAVKAALEQFARQIGEITAGAKKSILDAELDRHVAFLARGESSPEIKPRVPVPKAVDATVEENATGRDSAGGESQPSPKDLVLTARVNRKIRSFEKFAAVIGISRDTLYAVTIEKRWVSDEVYALIAQACGCRPAELHPRDLRPPDRRLQ